MSARSKRPGTSQGAWSKWALAKALPARGPFRFVPEDEMLLEHMGELYLMTELEIARTA